MYRILIATAALLSVIVPAGAQQVPMGSADNAAAFIDGGSDQSNSPAAQIAPEEGVATGTQNQGLMSKPRSRKYDGCRGEERAAAPVLTN